eukprot:gene7028-4231_t
MADYYGPQCNVACSAKETCRDRGSCGVDGLCECHYNTVDGFWGGPQCDMCHNNDTHGKFASPETGCRNCLPGMYGALCTVACDAESVCSGHGRCDADGACTCNNDADGGYWAGTACDRCADEFVAPDCVYLPNPDEQSCPVSIDARFSMTRGEILVTFSTATDALALFANAGAAAVCAAVLSPTSLAGAGGGAAA